MRTEGRGADVASALVNAAQRCGTPMGVGVLSTLDATLPGGLAKMSTKVVAAFTTTAFAIGAVLVELASRRSRMTFGAETLSARRPA